MEIRTLLLLRKEDAMTGKQAVILGILAVYMVFTMVIGIWQSRVSARQHSSQGFLDNYFAGGRGMGGFILAMTLVATYTSASSFLGGPGLAASFGLTQSWEAGIQIATTFLTLGVLGKKFALISRRIDAVTVTDYLRARYKSAPVVIISGIALIVFFTTQMVAQFIGGATLMQTVTGLPYMWSLLLFAAVVIIYTSVGGFRAVVVTDMIQGIIMTCGTFLLLFFILKTGGGLHHLTSQLNQINPGWNLMGKGHYGKGIIALQPGYLISFWVLVGIATLGLPQTAVRCMGFKDTRSMHRAMVYGTVVVGILMIGMHFAGTIAAPLIPKGAIKTTDSVIPYVVLHYMPTWAAGLFLAAPLAAVMSTVDSLLILASATIIKDLYLHYIVGNNPEREEKAESRVQKYSFGITLLLGIITCIIAMNPPDIIVWINLFAFGGLEAAFFWPMIGGLYWKKGNATACIASMIASLSVFIFFNRVKIAPFHIHEIVLGLLAGGIVYFLAGRYSYAKHPFEVDSELL